MSLQRVLGFLGFGNMGQAILRNLLARGTVSKEHAIVWDIDPGKVQEAKLLGVVVASSAEELARESDMLLLAVKPQSMGEALAQVAPALSPDTLVISIAAGISIKYVQSRLGDSMRVVRVMPNTPALVGAGMAGIALSGNCSSGEAETARTIFEAVGAVEMVSEEALDAVTALSGSGPAYFFYMVECMTRAAAAHGLREDQAARFAAQTLLGAGRLLCESGETPQVLRERVTSKGGTTEAALARFRALGFEDTIREGVGAAVARSKELGK